MDVSPNALRRDLMAQLRMIEAQMAEMDRHAATIGIKGYQLRDANDAWTMTPLILAKAQVYAALVQLQSIKK